MKKTKQVHLDTKQFLMGHCVIQIRHEAFIFIWIPPYTFLLHRSFRRDVRLDTYRCSPLALQSWSGGCSCTSSLYLCCSGENSRFCSNLLLRLQYITLQYIISVNAHFTFRRKGHKLYYCLYIWYTQGGIICTLAHPSSLFSPGKVNAVSFFKVE